MRLLLIPLLIGILLSPCLDERFVWAAIPITIVTLTLASLEAAPYRACASRLEAAPYRACASRLEAAPYRACASRPRGRGWCLWLLVALIGAADASRVPTVPPVPEDAAVRVVGKLLKAPEWRGLGTYLDVELQSIDTQPYRGRARLTEFLNEPDQRELFEKLDLGSGDCLEIVVKLHRPVVYRDPGVFNYRRHLERQGIYWTGTIRNPRLITILDRGWHGRDRIKKWIQGKVEAPFDASPDDQAIKALVTGMVLGRKYGLTAEVEKQFKAVGGFHPA